MCDNCQCSDNSNADNQEKNLTQKVEEIIDAVRPNLQAHGGDIELVEVDDKNNVKVRLQGACNGCPGARMTLKMGVERLLKEKLPQVNQVIPVE